MPRDHIRESIENAQAVFLAESRRPRHGSACNRGDRGRTSLPVDTPDGSRGDGQAKGVGREGFGSHPGVACPSGSGQPRSHGHRSALIRVRIAAKGSIPSARESWSSAQTTARCLGTLSDVRAASPISRPHNRSRWGSVHPSLEAMAMNELDPTRAALLALDFQNYGVHPQGYWASHGEPDWPAIARPAVDTQPRCSPLRDAIVSSSSTSGWPGGRGARR
jgi:hypothetical protein